MIDEQKNEIQPLEFGILDKNVYQGIRNTLKEARVKVYTSVNFAMVEAYWDVGRQIEEAVGDRAEYGKGLLRYLAQQLMVEFGKGFDESSLRRMRQFYVVFPNRATLWHELSWSHYRLLIKIDFEDKIKLPDDNPTIGIILCTDKNETMAKYSVLSDNENLFASKYMLYLPTEEELRHKLKRERELIELQHRLESGSER